MKTYDVAVIGGGPAGTAAAIPLSRAGYSTLVLEARATPHDKLCGEFLSPECRSLLEQLGVGDTIRALHPTDLQTASLIASDGTRWTAPLPGALGLSRYQLDHALLTQAAAQGAVVHDAETCTGVSGNLHDGFRLTTRTARGQEAYRARVVISAHGKRSIMDRALGRHFLGLPYPLFGMKRHFRGPALTAGVELHGFKGGYCGLAMVEDGTVNLCFLADETVFRYGGGRVEPFLKQVGHHNPLFGEWLKQAEPVGAQWLSVGALAFGARGPVHRDVLLAGDAAGLIAPLAGDGIAMALRNGQLCAAQVVGFMQGHQSADKLKTHYTRRWNTEFLPRIRLAGWLQSLALRPPLFRAALQLFRLIPPVGRWAVNHTRASASPTPA